jgi:hypothetical protein
MRYADVIKLGFKRIDDHCQQWEDQYGYEYFRVERELSKGHYIDLDVQERTCTLNTVDKESNILFQWETDDIELVKKWINVFTKVRVEANSPKSASQNFQHFA